MFRATPLLLSLLLVAVAGTGCGKRQQEPTLPAAQTGCAPKQAQILVQTGTLVRICGCGESGATPIAPPASLRCTVSTGTRVLFLMPETLVQHQIVSDSTVPAFDPSPLGAVSHPAQFNAAGTYPFSDALNRALNGQIIVN